MDADLSASRAERSMYSVGRPGVHAYHKHPVLLLPSGPDKVEALSSHGSESANSLTLLLPPSQFKGSMDLQEG